MSLSNFTNQYQLNKTLRFALIPQGETLAQLQNKGLLEEDRERAVSYQKMKQTIDAFHKHFIDLAMQNVKLDGLAEYKDLYGAPADQKKTDQYKKNLELLQAKLRKQIAKGFRAEEVSDIFGHLDSEKLFSELLENWRLEPENKDIYFDESFKTFTTYFRGFNENRKNMYTDKAQTTAIAFRLIHENLPKFLDNIRIFDILRNKKGMAGKVLSLYSELKDLLNLSSIDEAFSLDFFNKVLTQKGIDAYNLIIGGCVHQEGTRKIQGLNEYINEFNQRQKEKTNRIPKLKLLYKQILSDRESNSFNVQVFESGQEVLGAVNNYYHSQLISFSSGEKEDTINVMEEIKELLKDISSYDLKKIYIRNAGQLANISQQLFGSYAVFGDALSLYYDKVLCPAYQEDLQNAKSDAKRTKLEKEKERFTKQEYVSLGMLQKALDHYIKSLDVTHQTISGDTLTCIADYFYKHFKVPAQKGGDKKEFDLVANIYAKYSCIKGKLENYPVNIKLYQDKKTIDDLKLFLDSLMELLHFVKPLMLSTDNTYDRDYDFYGLLEPLYEQLALIVPLYNKVRNYATQKPYSTEKYKLNFENAQLLDGWPIDREIATSSVIFKEEGKYFLGILDKKFKKDFKNLPAPNNNEDIICKMNYLQSGDPGKVIQNLMVIDGETVKKNGRQEKSGKFIGQNLVLEELKNTYLPENINKIRKSRSYSKSSPEFKKDDLITFIDFYKQRAKEYLHRYEFKFKSSSDYKDFGEFTDDINGQAYQINFVDISKKYIYQLVQEGKLYLFQIYNKDFSVYSKGSPNLHTLYWKALFDSNNLANIVYKLNGGAEMFYRKASIEKANYVIHPAKQAIDNKNPLAIKKQSIFDYDLLKDKRYTVNKFLFHVPITLNFKAIGNENINQNVLRYLQNNPDVKIIGIDRGERHLIYLTLIDQEGNLLKQESLNNIVSDKYSIETPYHDLLNVKEKERDTARKSWGTIENIKELKEGFLSQVVHKIAKMMVEHNAIVVMEDLNFGFKRGRFKVEKQVYQKLEKMLIDKLNYLVFKDKEPNMPGGLYQALQLTNKFISFREMGKQSGFLFYVPAWNTSKIDPTTGFVNLFDTRYENLAKAQEFFQTFKSIRYNSNEGYFEFSFDYNDFTTRAKDTKTEWTVCSYGKRIMTFRNPEANNQWDNKEVDLTVEIEELLGRYEIIYGDGLDIRKRLLVDLDKKFYEKLLQVFKLTLQMRNSKTGTDIDYLISPVMGEDGLFYDSRKAISGQPKDADANGAYHIAKKGLWILNRINKTEDFKKLKLAVSNKEWLQFVQKK